MSHNLFIVESPAKCGKIEHYLGPGNKCIASYGHFRELNGLQSINIHNNFEPTFIISETKQSQVNKIKKALKEAKEVFLATDDDREGEAIAWHLCDYFGLPIHSTKRIVFHEVTETALKTAVSEYRYLNMEIVHAQLARQVMDIIVGYKLSPILWKNVKDGTSAGRCQTPALRLVYENYKAIKASPGSKEYNTTGYFTAKNIPFVLNHNFIDANEGIGAFLKESIDFEHVYNYGELRDLIKAPPSPFTTSKLQQSASTNLHTSPKDTMKICQKLYEEGYITYMRTDSAKYAEEFVDTAVVYIEKEYGKEYCKAYCTQEPEKQTKKNKKNKKVDLAQEAHEAIRPTNINIKQLPDGTFTVKETKMYQLIWSNTLESLMTDAKYKGLTATITAPQHHTYKFITEQVVFPGWKCVNGCEETSKEFAYLQSLKQSSVMKYKKITAKVSIKELKSHYTEAKLVQLLEEKGIGRPSTFSALIDKIQERGYVKKENVQGVLIKCQDYELLGDKLNMLENEREFGNEKNKLVIKPLGILVLDYLLANFEAVFDYDYTKQMEEQLDNIAQGKKVWHELCKECLSDLDTGINATHKGKETFRIDNEHMYIMGKYGPVLKCTSKPTGDTNNKKDIVTFKPVKPDIDIEKLRRGEYTLAQVLLEPTLSGPTLSGPTLSGPTLSEPTLSEPTIVKKGRSLGIYKEKEVFLKSGKFGWYVEWGTEKKSLKLTLEEADILELDTVADVLYDIANGNTTVIRVISKETSIRKGKGEFDDYIFHKNAKMKKPKFLKLGDFKGDYKKCDIELLHAWLKKTYDITKCE